MPVTPSTRESRRHEAKLRRDAVRARYGTQVNVSDPEGDYCCCIKASVVRIVVNLMLGICGVCILALGTWATSGRIAAIFGAYPGVGLVAVAATLVVTALLGEYASRADNKCLLLVYFLVIFVGFAMFLISGIVVLADGPGADSSIVTGWCSFPESAARAQEAFSCCGLSCPSDLPAQGACPDGGAFNGTLPACEAGNSNSAVCTLPLASRPMNSSLPGCKSLAAAYVDERIVPLFAAALAIGVLLLAAMIVACKLLCKRSRPPAGMDHGGKAMSEAVGLNSAQGSSDGWIDASAVDSGAGVAPAEPLTMSTDSPTPAGAAGAAAGQDSAAPAGAAAAASRATTAASTGSLPGADHDRA